MRTHRLRLLALLPVLALMCATLVAVAAQPAAACPSGQTCPPGDTGGGGDSDEDSSATVEEHYNDGGTRCSVYANGGGMGMYCVGGGQAYESLRERFGDMKFQRCRYDEIPPSIEPPFNANPDKGRYMLMSCLENIDFDTYSGGHDRSIDISLVFVPNGTDTADRDNPLNDFLWDQFARDTQMPVPFMQARPNQTPLVGIPTYFTFRWTDPATKDVVAEGPYDGRDNGGPFREIRRQGVVMQARASKITINPQQEGIKAVTCDPDTPYIEGASPKNQPDNACKIVFPRSSASARKYATKPIPAGIDDAFYADITVTWDVTYGPEGGGEMQELGDGFTMRIRQVVPVQEVQAPNQPPAVIY